METITVNAVEWNELVRKINLIAEFIGQLAGQFPVDDNAWMDEAQVCGYLKVSTKTLQRLRNSGGLKFSTIAKKHHYKAGDIKMGLRPTKSVMATAMWTEAVALIAKLPLIDR